MLPSSPSSASALLADAVENGRVGGLSLRRVWTTVAMLALTIGATLLFGHAAAVVCTFVMQALMYREAVTAAIIRANERELPAFRGFYYYWYCTAVFFSYGRLLRPQLLTVSYVHLLGFSVAQAAERFHLLLSFMLYVGGFVSFICSLRVKKLYRYQLGQFAYCHIALALILWQSTFLVQNLFHGIAWWLLPAFLVASNDIGAYVCGKWFGASRIPFSAKHTWEGFVGAFGVTMVCGVLLAHVVPQVPLLACSLYNADGTSKGLFNWTVPASVDECDDEYSGSGIYEPKDLTYWFDGVLEPLPRSFGEIYLTQFQVHALWLSLFASLIAPFGGFFSSRVKRMHGISRWSNVIPGHGGFLDRFDCHILMGLFVAVYHATFIMPAAPNFLAGQLAAMSAPQQHEVLCSPKVLTLLARVGGGVGALRCDAMPAAP